MDITLKNCNNIADGIIHIEEKKLNIKYGLNGTGKTTIVKALKLMSENSELKELIPYKYRDKKKNSVKPEIIGLENINRIKIFNEDYINKFVFQEDELLKGSYEVFIRDTQFIQCEERINSFLENINNTFTTNNELNLFIEKTSDFLKNCKKNTDGSFSQNSVLGKSLINGNKLENLPTEIKVYSKFLNSNKSTDWYTWQAKGINDFYNLSSRCPFCARKSVHTLDKSIHGVHEYFDKGYVSNLNKMLDSFKNISDYITTSSQNKLKKLKRCIDSMNDEQLSFIDEILTEIELINQKVVKIKNLSFMNLKDITDIKLELHNYIIDINNYTHLCSKRTKELMKIINQQLKALLKTGLKLQEQILKQKGYLAKSIGRYSEEITDFLKYAGFNYCVKFNTEDNQAKLNLYSNDYKVTEGQRCLSYGEKNTLSLIMFMYESLKEKPDLIVLDDPISSFDGNKRFAVLHKLFIEKSPTKNIKINFRNTTVIMLTHEFSVLVDIVKTMHKQMGNSTSASYIYNNNGILSEKKIRHQDIKTFIQIADENIEQSSEIINKLIFLRKRFEVENKKQLEWNILSSLFHKDNKPSQITTDGRKIEMTDSNYKLGVTKIIEKISSFNYQDLLNDCHNVNLMYEKYKSSKSNYEKLQIYRIINNDNSSNSVIKKFINETFHVDNDFIYQLNPLEYELVPDYVIEICNLELEDIISNFNRVNKESNI